VSSRIVAQRAIDGTVLSTANIYFTSHDSAGAHVFRTAQTATPGQESELCREANGRFGDIIFANISGSFFGYFFALVNGSTTIRRIPLAPSPGEVAKVVGPSIPDLDIVTGNSNLATDGTSLYWQTDSAVNRMPIAGGPITVLDHTDLTRPVMGLQIVNMDIFYAAGRLVYHVPANGPVVAPPSTRIFFNTATGVAAFATRPGSIYLADRNGAVGWHSENGTGQILQAPGAAYVTSLTYDATHSTLAWTQMASTWQMRVEVGANIVTTPVGANPCRLIVGGTGEIFWSDDEGLRAFHL
jgi:hypothetical protein